MKSFILGLFLGLVISAGWVMAENELHLEQCIDNGRRYAHCEKLKDLNDLADESAKNTDKYFQDKCLDDPKLYYCQFMMPNTYGVTPVRNGVIVINTDLMTQWDMKIKIEHDKEEIKLSPLELWRRATLSKKQT